MNSRYIRCKGPPPKKKCIGQISVGVGIGPFPNNWPSFTPRKSTPMDIWKCFFVFCRCDGQRATGRYPLRHRCHLRCATVAQVRCSDFDSCVWILSIFNIFHFFLQYFWVLSTLSHKSGAWLCLVCFGFEYFRYFVLGDPQVWQNAIDGFASLCGDVALPA